MRNLFILALSALWLAACSSATAVNSDLVKAEAACMVFTASGFTNALVQGACLDVSSITPATLAVIEAAIANLPAK